MNEVPGPESTGAIVDVTGGRIRGMERHGVWSFSGIPYAAAPVGGRRWRPPGAVEPWEGVRDGTRFGPVAPQAPSMVDLTLGGDPEELGEDCLNLNIWTPAPDGGRRPVMVWIHGGSFVTGSGSGGLYRGGMLAREGDVVVVTVNYRLGMLGFLAHPALADPGQTWLDGRPWTGTGNWGIADQVAALWWVRDNIAAFGGDPGNVTIFGESAGGMSVSTLLGVDAARGLYHRAIVQSGPPYTATAEDAAATAERLAAHLGVPVTREALEQVPADRLVAAVTEVGQIGSATDNSGLLLKPVVDGGLVATPPADSVAAGAAAGIPLLIGTTRDESAFFLLGSPALLSLDDEGLRRWMRRVSPDVPSVETLIADFTGARTARGELVAPRDLWSAIATEYLFRHPTIRMADAHHGAADPAWAPSATSSPGSRPRSTGSSARVMPSSCRSCSGRCTTRWSRPFRVRARTRSRSPRRSGVHGSRSPATVTPAGSGRRGIPSAGRRRCWDRGCGRTV